MVRRRSRAPLLVIAVLAFPDPAAAQDPQAASPTTRLIPYTAVLPGSGADAMAAARAITFALFDEATDGTLLWTETQTVSVDARGRYTAHLGAVTALALEIFRTEQARWLEVTVDGTALPRTMLVAVPYALRAADAGSLGGKPLSAFVLTDDNGRRVRPDGTAIDDPTVDGTGVPNQIAKWSDADTLSSSIVTESFDNRIGILAPDPTGGGVVDSRFTIRQLDNNTAIGVLNTLNQRRFALNTLATGAFRFFDGGSGGWNAGLMQLNGSVGIGVVPAARLDVRQDGSTQEAGFFHVSHTANNQNGLVSVHNGIGHAILAIGTSGAGISAVSSTGPAGLFGGNVTVTGTLSKGGGAFQIDHPLDPANKYLQHSFVESPDMMNIYNGNVTLDAHGEAWVTLPAWFQALNRDFRYQLTSIGTPSSPYIASEIDDNRFRIAGGTPNGKVSWQVTGIRQDAWANANRIEVEKDKPASDRGRYLHPAAFDLPAAMGVPAYQVPSRVAEKLRQR